MKSTLFFLVSFTLVKASVFAAVPKPAAPSVAPSTSENDKAFQRDRALVLQKKNEIARKVPQALPTEIEKKIYEELVQAFERNDELSFQSRFQKMRSEFPRSIYADEVLYLAGMMAFSNKLYGRALSFFDQVMREYPRSNRSRAALYAKAAVYRKMNLKPQAINVFNRVTTQYPGSPEARRAQVDLKTIR